MKKNWLYLFCTYIFFHFILLTEIHRHHILALLLGYIGAIFANGSRFILDFWHVEDYPYHLLNAFLCLLYSLALVLTKYSMIKFILLSPYIFLFNRIFYIVISFIITFLQYPMIINLPDRNTRIDKSEENNKYFSNNFIEIIKFFIGQKSGFYIFFFNFHFFFFLLYYFH